MKGFIPHIIENTETEALYHIEATASATYKIGEALIISSGKAAIDSAGAFPQYLCRTAVTLGSAGGVIAVTPLRDDIVYETEVGTTISGGAIGAQVTIDSDGMTVEAVGSGQEAVFEIVDAEGFSAGDTVYVRVLK